MTVLIISGMIHQNINYERFKDSTWKIINLLIPKLNEFKNISMNYMKINKKEKLEYSKI